jgi:hypothetical protein
MSAAVLNELLEAKRAGGNLRAVFEQSLHRKYKSDVTWSHIFFGLSGFVGVLVLAALGLLIARDSFSNLASLSGLAALKENPLTATASVGATIGTGLFGWAMQLRRDQKRHFCALMLLMDGHALLEAINVMLDGKAGKGSTALKVLGSAVSLAS